MRHTATVLLLLLPLAVHAQPYRSASGLYSGKQVDGTVPIDPLHRIPVADLGKMTVAGALMAMQNALNESALLQTVRTPCAGNSGQNGADIGRHQFAYGWTCIFVQPPFGNFGGKQQYAQTYAMQIGLEVPGQAHNPNITPGPGRETDQVAFYPEVRLGAYSPGGWAENPLVALGANSGGGIISEMDLNNFEGCDSSGIDTDANSTGGSNTFTMTRSDGSACPGAEGVLVTGVGNRISRTAIEVSGVSNTAGDMWQDGVRMIGGYLINEADIIEDTGARSVLKAEGTHVRGLDLKDGHYGFAAVSLPLSNDGKLLWECPTGAPSASLMTKCVSGYPKTPMLIEPEADGAMHFTNGAPWTFDGSMSVTQGATIKGGILSGSESHFSAASTSFADPTPGVGQAVKISGGAAVDVLITDPAGNAPLHSRSACIAGQTAWDATYEYRCIATNNWQRWKRSAETW